MTERKMVTLDDIERRLIASHQKPYYDWLRHVVTLAVGSLTALVTLQGHYVPRNPELPIALALTWITLAMTIFLGIFALRAEYSLPLAAARDLQSMRATYGDNQTASLVMSGRSLKPSWHHRWAVRLMLSSFFVAVSSLCVFSIKNLGVI